MLSDNSLPNMKIRSITSYHLPVTNYHGASGTISTLVERALQIRPFMQNEPNFRKSQMNVSNLYTKDYGNKPNWTLGENEPKTNPIYPVVASGEAGSNPTCRGVASGEAGFQTQKNVFGCPKNVDNYYYGC